MKNTYRTLLAAALLTATLLIGAPEANAQSSISLQSTLKRTYFVEVHYHFWHWTSGGQQFYWSTVLETESYHEAQQQYKITKDALDRGALDSSGTTSITTAIDVRIRTVYEPIYQSTYTRLWNRFR